MRQEREAAWEEGRKEGHRAGVEEGHRAGLEEGMLQVETQMLRKLVQKKLEKGKSVAEIASELEEPEERIRNMIDESVK